MNNNLHQIFIDNNYPRPKEILQDEKINRFGDNNKYWYIAFENWIVIGDWSDELPKISQAIDQKSFELLSDNKKYELQSKISINSQRQTEEKALAQDEAKKEALNIWESLSQTGDSKYLANKNLTTIDGIKFGNDDKGNFIATTLIDNANIIWSLQFIYDNDFKKFLKNGKIKGCYSELGDKEAQEIYICEGLATGLSILLAKPSCLVVIAYNCHNLQEVASNILVKYPNKTIIIAGDNDFSKKENAGKKAALATAEELKLKYVLPNFDDFGKEAQDSSDFDDLKQIAGSQEAKRQLTENINDDFVNKGNLNILPITKFLSTTLPEREYIIEPILPKQGLMMVYALRGVGKTHFSLQLACNMAMGVNLFENRWKVNKKWRVLYIDGEMPANAMQERLSSLINGFATTDVNDNLSILTPDLQEYGKMPNLASKDGQKELEPYIKDVDVVVVDNLSTLCSYGKENESNSWTPIQEWALKLRSQGKSIIFIHHAGKNNDQRGTSKKEDILDTSINLKHPEDYDAKQGARFEIHFEKSRGFAGDEAKSFEVKLNLEDNKASWQISEIEDLEIKQVLELSELGMNHRAIASEMQISESKAYRILKKNKVK